MNDEYIQTWRDLSDLVERYRTENWIFRGVVDCSHELLPKIGRPGARKDLATGNVMPFDVAAENVMLKRFAREMRPHLNARPEADYNWLAVAQHHGLATRLLDWSESPLIAAYFAVEPAGIVDGEQMHAGLYGTPCPEVMDPSATGWRFDDGKPVVAFYPPHIAPRITVQRGLFTVHENPSVPWRPAVFRKWTIPSHVCIYLKLALHRAGINRATLFPDLDGIAEHINWLHKWGIP